MDQVYTLPPEKSRGPALYAVIPAPVLFDDQLRAGAKLLYGVITALGSHGDDCWATDDYFAEIFQTNVKTIQAYLRNLSKAKYISIVVDQHTAPGQRTRRRIILNVSFAGEHGNKNSEHGNKNSVEQENLEPCPTSNINKKDIYREKPLTIEEQMIVWVEQYGAEWDEATRLDIAKALRDFIQFRKESKHPLTKTGMTTLLNKLNRLAYNRPILMSDMIYTAIDNGWRTVYLPKAMSQNRGFSPPMPSDDMEAF